MQELNRLDRCIERPLYSNPRIAELHQHGLLSRLEAEVLDIIDTGLALEDEAELAEMGGMEEQWESSCVAIIHEGTVIPILSLEEIIQRSSATQRRVLCREVASVIYDVLLSLLEVEGGDNG